MRIRVPATSANLGPGFDTLGMALDIYNYFEAEPSEHMKVCVSKNSTIDVSNMSLDPSENLIAKTYYAYFRFRHIPVVAVKFLVEAHIPFSRGLGSSSSAIVGGLMLANSLHPSPLDRQDLLSLATDLEGHPDNVTPALLGGVHCCMNEKDSFVMNWPKNWGIILVIPPYAVSTEKAREVLPVSYSRDEAVKTLRGIAAWINAIRHEDERMFNYAISSDCLHQPAREKLIPEFSLLKNLLDSTEALGCVISGSGSTLAVYTPSSQSHEIILSLLKKSDLSHCQIKTVHPDYEGAVFTSMKLKTSS